jgi:hypothetical protein
MRVDPIGARWAMDFYSAIDAIAPWCWPSIAASILLARGIVANKQRLAPATRNALNWVVFAMLIWPFPFTIVFYNRSATMMANAEAGLVALGLAVLAGAYLRRSAISDVKFAGIFVFGGLMAGIGSWILIGDFVLPRESAQGTLIRKSAVFESRHRTYYIQIDGGRFSTTGEIYDRFEKGARIHAEIGAGSNTVLHATPLPL